MKTLKFIAFIALLFGITSCHKSKESFLMTAKINGENISIATSAYALKTSIYKDGNPYVNRYIINGLDQNGGFYMWVTDSTALKTEFDFDDFEIVTFSQQETEYPIIAANLKIIKENGDLLIGGFNMTAMNGNDTLHVTDGYFELPFENSICEYKP